MNSIESECIYKFDFYFCIGIFYVFILFGSHCSYCLLLVVHCSQASPDDALFSRTHFWLYLIIPSGNLATNVMFFAYFIRVPNLLSPVHRTYDPP